MAWTESYPQLPVQIVHGMILHSLLLIPHFISTSLSKNTLMPLQDPMQTVQVQSMFKLQISICIVIP